MLASRPVRPRGRPPTYVTDRDGRPIVGLSRNPDNAIRKKNGKTYTVTDGRYYATGSNPREYFGSDFDLAVMRFRAWQARQRGQHVEFDYEKLVSPESRKKINLIHRVFHKPPIGDTLSITSEIPDEIFWNKVREYLSDGAGRRLAAQRTGIKEIEYIFDLEPPPKPLTLEEIGDLYANKKPPLSSDERKQSKQFWKQFRDIVGVPTLDLLTQAHIDRYRDRVYELQGNKTSCFVSRRFTKVKTVFFFFYKNKLDPNQSKRILGMLTTLIPPAKGKALPSPISKSDLEKLLKVADVEETAMLLLGLNCAFYPVDIRLLTKTNGLDLERGIYAGYRHKTHIPQCSVLWKRTIEQLKKHLAENPNATDRLFVGEKGKPYSSETFRRKFAKLRFKARVSDRVLFDHLRDGAASNANADQRQVDVLLGHRSAGLTDNYVLRHPQLVADACKNIERHYFE